MSYSENDCRFIGNLGKDIELKYAKTGTAICNFSIATTKSIKKGDGYENTTTWVSCVAFGKVAEHLMKYAKKGTTIRVIGEYSVSTYTDDNNNKKYNTQIIANTARVMTGGIQSGEQSSSQESSQESSIGVDLQVDDLPF